MEYETEYKPAYKKWTYEAALHWIKKVLQEYNAPLQMLAETVSLEKELSVLPQTRESFGLVHYDFNFLEKNVDNSESI